MSLACKIMDLEQDTEEWLNFRRGKIGGSDIPKILGISSYGTPYELWKEMLGFTEKTPMNPAMYKGKQIEPLSRRKVNAESNSSFVPSVLQHKDFEWAIYSSDGIDQAKKIIWECKYNKKEFHAMALENKLPPEHYAQVQWGLFVSGYDVAWYTSNNDQDDITIEVLKDFDFIKDTLLPKASEFYHYLTSFTPPPTNAKDYVKIEDDQFNELAHSYKLVSSEMKALKDKQDKIKEMLIEFTDDGNCEGGGIKIFRKGGGVSVDYKGIVKAIYENYPDIKSQFPEENFSKEQIGYWCITIDKKKE